MSFRVRELKPSTKLPAGAGIAAVASGAMIAQQVAGKAARDAIFLSSFRVQHLPIMIAASAVASLVGALMLSRLMVRHSPAKVVPAVFALSGALLMGEWLVSFVSHRTAAAALYVHTALFGAVVISAFWSLVNETFALHSGKRAVSWVAGGGTMGGVLGGLVTWRASDHIPLFTMLPILAAVNVVCMWGSHRLHTAKATARGDAAAAAPVPVPEEPDAADAGNPSVLRLLWRAPYLGNLALIVALGAVTSGLLDYVFSAVAVEHYGKGPQLLAFFAKFWLGVGLVSFLLQTLLGRLALEKLGLAVTVGILPALVVLGAALGLAVPGVFSMVVLRGGEATQRNSLFRAAYELLYTPLSEQKKRATKTLIDVGCDRLGTALAGGIALAALALFPAPRAGVVLLVIAMVCGLVSVARSVPLHRGYVALLEEGLRKAAAQMSPASASMVPAARESALRDKIVEQLEPTTEARPPGEKIESIDGPLRDVIDLRSGEPERVRRVLAAGEPLAAPIVGFALLLLADKEFHLDAIKALARAAPACTGQLIDALCDPRVDYDTRRRIPRALSHCPTSAAADGLLRGLGDERFEVRYACGRALLRIREANDQIAIHLDRIVAVVTREVGRNEEILDTHEDDDDDDKDGVPTSLVDRLRLDRLDRTVEHVFNVLALHLDPISLRTAFKALHQEQDDVRGLALEYLETVLPDSIRDLVWPLVGEARPMRAARPAKDILADLVGERHA